MNNERLVPLDPTTLSAIVDLQAQAKDQQSRWLIEGARERPVSIATIQSRLVHIVYITLIIRHLRWAPRRHRSTRRAAREWCTARAARVRRQRTVVTVAHRATTKDGVGAWRAAYGGLRQAPGNQRRSCEC